MGIEKKNEIPENKKENASIFSEIFAESSWTTTYKSYWEKSFQWHGRATRAEYWCPFLINFIIYSCLSRLIGSMVLSVLFGIAVICPNLAVLVRRFHDLGRSAKFALIPTFATLFVTVLTPVSYVLPYIYGEAIPQAFVIFYAIVYTIFGYALPVLVVVWFLLFPALPGKQEANKYGEPR
jgi:uncharacterized membrane protein YhaH (DUF805 family)